MEALRESLGIIKDSIKRELNKVKKLKGERFDKFADILNLPADTVIYYNNFNVVIIDPITFDLLGPYLSDSNRILCLDVPEYNCHIWVYQYIGDQLLEDYLKR